MPRRLILAVCALAIAPAMVACGDDDDDSAAALPGASSTARVQSTNVAVNSASISGPVSKYSVSIEDIGLQWRTDIKQTIEIDSEAYAKTRGLFDSESAGKGLLKQWGYEGGYQTAYLPEGLDTAVKNGSYYITVESHLFETAEGAQAAYQYYISRLGTPLEIERVGDVSVGYHSLIGTFPGSTVKVAYHQVISRRGNVVTIVLTKGANGFMKIETPWKLAKIADDKLTGARAAIEPTPVSNYKPPTPESTPR